MRTPQEVHAAVIEQVKEGLKTAFPIGTVNRQLHLVDVHVDEQASHDDYESQKIAIMGSKTWGAPMSATVELRDAAGRAIDQKKVRLGLLPTVTNRHTYIVNGKEYQVSHQQRLRSGVYTKLNRLGEPVADFNLAKGRNFSVVLDPASSRFDLKYANTHVPLYPVVKHVFGYPSLGMGDESFNTPMSEEQEFTALRTLHAEVLAGKPVPEENGALVSSLKEAFGKTMLDSAITEKTLGTGHTIVNGDALIDAAHQVLRIHRGEVAPTTKEQMAYAEIHGVEDLLRERLEKNRFAIAGKVRRTLDRAQKVGEVNLQSAVQPLLTGFFTQSALSSNPVQVNPLEMRENAYKITRLGEGGISDTNAIPTEVRNVHPSQAGFIDPVRTPDNARAGIDVRAGLGVTKRGKQLVATVVDARTGDKVQHTPVELFDKVVAHDAESAEDGRIRAIHRGKLVSVRPDQVDFHIPTEQMFTVSTAMVPFVPNSHAHRVAMGAKMLGQALSLTDREAPIVDTNHSDESLKGILPVAPVAGLVRAIAQGHLVIAGEDGKDHRVNFPHEFPLNGGSYLHTDLHVKAGDQVTAGQVLGDSNFSKDGRIALGKNLHVAYIPYKGLNYEDGLVLTESGARKLTSNHLHTEELELDGRTMHDIEKYRAHFPGALGRDQVAKLDAKGVVRVGQTLSAGDPIMAVLRQRPQNPEQLVLGKVHKSLAEPYKDDSITWDKTYDGRVTAVHHDGSNIKVTVEAQAPAQVGDKLCGRYGNKGVVTAIISDDHAPHTADGKVPDLLINPAGLISRMNNGQIYEVVVGRALQKLGIPSRRFDQFGKGDTHEQVTRLVEAAGSGDGDEMFDPDTKRSIGHVMNGPMYVLKLFKQAESGFSARAGGEYDLDLRPAKGGTEGAKSVGHLDFFGLLAHGSKNLLREAATYKAERNPEVVAQMWRGAPLPPPKPTFAYRKFEAMLKGMGVNVAKDGSKMTLLPMTDKDVLAVSSGAITKPLMVNAKPDPVTNLPFRPEEGGIFDPVATGGLVGNRWSHIPLAEGVVNPMFAKPARTILGLGKQEFEEMLAREGAHGIGQRLDAIDPAARIGVLQRELVNTNAVARRDTIHKQIKYLSALERNGLRPKEAYILNHLPVIPPSMRPVYPDANTGDLVTSDANQLYQHLLMINEQLAKHTADGDPDMVRELRQGLHEAVSRVQGLDATTAAASGEREPQGFLRVIAGARAKDGFFQSKLISRRQDIAGRGVAVPSPTLGLDQIGLPEDMAWKLYRNHAMGELSRAGVPLKDAAKDVAERTDRAKKALEASMNASPAIMTRAPSLHRFNVQAFKPQLVAGKSIEVNTLIHKGFNLDHDGDCCLGTVVIARKSADFELTNSTFNRTLNSSPKIMAGGVAMLLKESYVPVVSGYTYEVVDLADFPRLEDTKRTKENGNSFYDVPEGIHVFAYDPADGRIKLFPVTEYSVHPNLQMVKVTTRSGRTVDCSEDHSLYGIDPRTLVVQKMKPPESLGCLIPRPRKVTTTESVSTIPMGTKHNANEGHAGRYVIADHLELDLESGWFIGAMAGDGYASREGGRLGFCNVAQPTFDRIKEFLLIRVCAGLSFSEHDNPHDFDGHACFSRKLHWTSKSLNAFVAEQIGQDSENKHLPTYWIASPESFRWGLLAGLLDTDGRVMKTVAQGGRKINWHVGYDSKSEQLIDEVLMLCSTLGVRATKRAYKNKKGLAYYQAAMSVTDVRTYANKILLSTPAKAGALLEMVAASPENQSTHDTIPVPRELALALRKTFGAPRDADGRHKSLYILIDKATKKGGMNRDTAKEVIRRIGDARVGEMPLGARWLTIVNTDETLWDEVVKIEKSESGVTAYDMTVPGSWTFMLANGLVVQDCVTIHVPVTPEGASDAFQMLPSNNLYATLNGAPVHVPTQETIMGLYKVTSVGHKPPVAKFASRADAVAAYQRGEVRVHDPIEILEG